MYVVNNLEEFKMTFKTGRKWKRAIEAFTLDTKVLDDVYYNIGDSLVFMNSTYNKVENEYMERHERYLDIHYVLGDEMLVRVIDKDKAKIKYPYKDETDTAYYEEDGDILSFKKGNIVIFEPDDVFKFINDVNKIVVKLSIEDNLFLNK